MATLRAVRDRLEEAAWFARAGDPTAAVERAKAAARMSEEPHARAEAMLAIGRFEAMELSWRAAIEARASALLASERARLRAPGME